MNAKSEWVVVGRFGRTHGIKGLITVISFTDPRDNILSYKNWHAHINQQWQSLKLLHIEKNSKSILVYVDGYLEREEAARLTNVDIAIQSEQLPLLKQGEYYWHQLIGMQVVTQQGITLGTVTEMIPTGSNDVLTVVGEKRHLIPYLPDRYIIDINDSQQVITVDWDVDF